uniref:Uncharacterized protein n=1 Tax=Rhizophora mucronata TaxID=61149 RepID=A0A2P2NIR0_RHIMU
MVSSCIINCRDQYIS